MSLEEKFAAKLYQVSPANSNQYCRNHFIQHGHESNPTVPLFYKLPIDQYPLGVLVKVLSEGILLDSLFDSDLVATMRQGLQPNLECGLASSPFSIILGRALSEQFGEGFEELEYLVFCVNAFKLSREIYSENLTLNDITWMLTYDTRFIFDCVQAPTITNLFCICGVLNISFEAVVMALIPYIISFPL